MKPETDFVIGDRVRLNSGGDAGLVSEVHDGAYLVVDFPDGSWIAALAVYFAKVHDEA